MANTAGESHPDPMRRLRQAVAERRAIRNREEDKDEVEKVVHLDSIQSEPTFENARWLATGGFGVVYECTWRHMDRKVAVKFLRPSKKGLMSKHFEWASKSMGRVHHQNFAQVYTYGILHGLPYCIMDLIPNAGHLHSLRKTFLSHIATQSAQNSEVELKRLQQEQAWNRDLSYRFYRFAAERFSQAADVLTLLHEGVKDNHGDLFPRNFLIQRYSHTNDAKHTTSYDETIDTAGLSVGNNSIAKIFLIDAMGIPSGNDVSALPVRIASQDSPLGQNDIRNFCEAMCTALFADFAYASPPIPEVTKELSADVVEDLRIMKRSRVPKSLLRILKKGLSPISNERYQSARDLADDLRMFSQLRPMVYAKEANRIKALWENGVLWSMRSPAQLILSAATVVALLATSLAWYRSEFFRSRSEQLLATETRQRIRAENAERNSEQNLAKLKAANDAKGNAEKHDIRTNRITLGILRENTSALEKLVSASTDNFTQKHDEIDTLVSQWRSYAENHEDRITGQLSLAEGLERVGCIYQVLGNHDSSKRLFTECLNICDSLPSTTTNGNRSSITKTAVLSRLANSHFQCGDAMTAIGLYQDALSLASQDHAENDNTALNEAILHSNIGLARTTLCDYAGALHDLHIANKYFSTAAHDTDGFSKISHHAARSLNNTGLLQVTLGKYSDALCSFKEAVIHHETMTSKMDDAPHLRCEAATVRANLAYTLVACHQPKAAIDTIDSAVRSSLELVATHPSCPIYQYTLAYCHFLRGEILYEVKTLDPTDYFMAINILERRLQNESLPPEYESLLACCHSGCGAMLEELGNSRGASKEYDEALSIIRRMCRMFPDSVSHRMNLLHSLIMHCEHLTRNGMAKQAQEQLPNVLKELEREDVKWPNPAYHQCELARCLCCMGRAHLVNGNPTLSYRLLMASRDVLARLSDSQLSSICRNSKRRTLRNLEIAFMESGYMQQSEAVWNEIKKITTGSGMTSAVLIRLERLIEYEMTEDAIAEMTSHFGSDERVNGVEPLTSIEELRLARVMAIIGSRTCEGRKHHLLSIDLVKQSLARDAVQPYELTAIETEPSFAEIIRRSDVKEMIDSHYLRMNGTLSNTQDPISAE